MVLTSNGVIDIIRKKTEFNYTITEKDLENITEIADGAFKGMEHLKEIHMPESITKIGAYAFYGCTSLEEVFLTNEIVEIGAYAFGNCSSLESITLPMNELDTLSDGVFYKCINLNSISIPKTIKTIGSTAFSYCKNIHEIYYSGDIQEWCESNFTPLMTQWGGGKLFLDNSIEDSLKGDITIGYNDGVVKINDNAFRNCVEITSVKLSDNVTKVGNYAFFRDGVLSDNIIEGYVNNTIREPIYNNTIFAYCPTSLSGSYEVPKDIEIIAGGAFAYCQRLTEIILPATVEAIGDYCFAECRDLKIFKLPPKIKRIGIRAFWGCDSLQESSGSYYKALIKKNGHYYSKPHPTIKKENGTTSEFPKYEDKSFEYKEEGTYDMLEGNEPKICIEGFHACERLLDCFNYYYSEDIYDENTNEFNKDYVICKVELTDVAKLNDEEQERQIKEKENNWTIFEKNFVSDENDNYELIKDYLEVNKKLYYENVVQLGVNESNTDNTEFSRESPTINGDSKVVARRIKIVKILTDIDDDINKEING